MATPEEQFMHIRPHNTADFEQGLVPASTDGDILRNNHQPPVGNNTGTEKPTNKILQQGNAIIASIITLILLLSLNSPVCCNVITSGLTMSPVAAQSQQPPQILPASVTPRTETIKIEPTRAEAVIVKPTKMETVETRPTRATDTKALEFAAIAPASVTLEAAGDVNEDIKPDAVAFNSKFMRLF